MQPILYPILSYFLCETLISMQSASSSDGSLEILSGFDARNCYGSVLVWNNGSDPASATFNISGIPYNSFDVHVFRLDDDNMPGVSAPQICIPNRTSLVRESAFLCTHHLHLWTILFCGCNTLLYWYVMALQCNSRHAKRDCRILLITQ